MRVPVAAVFFSFALLMLAGGSSVFAQDEWPQFRGPDGQGHAEGAKPPSTWSETENITWKTPLPGLGFSSPVISGNRIWMTTATDEGHSLRALCVDRASGKLLHDVEVFTPADPVRINVTNSHASPSPVIEGDRVYVCFGTMGTACLDSETGEIVWENEQLILDHKEGPGSSPIIAGDDLVLNCDGMDVRYVVALDKRTGRIVWKTDRSVPPARSEDMNKAYCTPLLVEFGGRTQLISPGALHVASYDPETGKELWLVRYPNGYSNVPRPVVGDGLVFISTGFNKATLLAIRPGGTGDVTDTHVAWTNDKQIPTRPSPIYLDGRLYVNSDRGVLTCFRAATGDVIYTERLGGSYAASAISAGGLLYFCDEDGVTHVVKPGDMFEKVAENKLNAPIKASPAAVGKELYVRTTEALYRIEAK